MATPRNRLFALLVAGLLLGVSAAFEMKKSRFHPSNELREQDRRKSRASTAVAHKEKMDLENEIMSHRQQARLESFTNFSDLSEGGSDGASSGPEQGSEGRGRYRRLPAFEWESEEDKEWARPHLRSPTLFQELPPNQVYDREAWFSRYNDSTLAALSSARQGGGHKGGRMAFVFALSTGHCGTTTLSVASAYEEAGYDASRCHFSFETLAQGSRDFARRHPGRAAAKAYVQRFLLPAYTEMALDAGKGCFVDFGHHVRPMNDTLHLPPPPAAVF